MSIERSQPDPPSEQPEENQETAKNALKMAGFQIGDNVVLPYLSGENIWQITAATITTFYGRDLAAVELQSENSGDRITITLHDLCINNPSIKIAYPEQVDSTQIQEIDNTLTDNRIIYLREVGKDHSETKILFGHITNSPIEVGKSIASTVQAETHLVVDIIENEDRYFIKTEDGQTYIFDPADSLDRFETD